MKSKLASISIYIVSILFVTQYILAFFVFKLPGWAPLQWIGWAILGLSIIFGIAPIFILSRWGNVAKGKSYMHTEKLVDTSLYSIVRHPQYLAGILLNLAMLLLAQHWLVILLGFISIALLFRDLQVADLEGIEKFGDEYRQYIKRVPRANFLLGIYRQVKIKMGSGS
jgi:protein-S-isoprenylcysteine O-methyltransferase Ste14